MRSRRAPSILVDASDIDKPSGGRTAVLELFRAVFAIEPAWRYIVLVSREEPDFDLPHVRQIIIPVRSRPVERLWIQAAVAYFAMSGQVDLIHFARTMGGLAWPAKNVLTIFDLTTVLRPSLHTRSAIWYWRHIVPMHLRLADHVVAISHDVANGLGQYYRLPSHKVDVIYCAPQSVFDEPVTPGLIADVRRKYQLPEKYLFFVGILAKKKNLSTLIQAMHVLQQRGSDCPSLILAGRQYRQSDDSAIFQQIESLGLQSQVRYLGPVDGEDLRGLYGGATALVFPSLHEGFGIPCLEAMKCGLPVVAARSGAIPEIVGDAALLVDDPTNPQVLADSIQRIVHDASLRQELVARGRKRAALFSWQHFAGQLLALYRRLLET